MPPKRKASPSTSSRCARSRQEGKDLAKTKASTQRLAEFRERLRRHDIPYFRGSHKVQVRGPSNTLFTTSLQSLLEVNYVPCQILYPCYHIVHSCQFCHLLPDKPIPPHKIYSSGHTTTWPTPQNHTSSISTIYMTLPGHASRRLSSLIEKLLR